MGSFGPSDRMARSSACLTGYMSRDNVLLDLKILPDDPGLEAHVGINEKQVSKSLVFEKLSHDKIAGHRYQTCLRHKYGKLQALFN